MQAKRPDAVYQAGVEHDHACLAGRTLGDAGNTDKMPGAAKTMGFLAHHATSFRRPVTAWMSGCERIALSSRSRSSHGVGGTIVATLPRWETIRSQCDAGDAAVESST